MKLTKQKLKEIIKEEIKNLSEAISGSDRKIMMMIVRDILENFKKAGAKKPSDAVGRGVLSVLRAMTYTPDNANYKNYKKYFSKTFNSKLTQKKLKQFHSQTDKVQLTMVKQAMNKVLGEGKLTEKVQWKKDKKIKGKWYTNQGTHKHQAKANVIAGREWRMGRSDTHDTIVVKEPKGYTIYVRPLKEAKLTEAFKPTVTMSKHDKPFSQEHFASKNDAKKYIKQMIKKYKLNKFKGFWGNPKTGIELLTNF